ncbi:endonuclease-1 [Psychromonas sp. CNPT3]|nr:endonuclease-1 [Psychromonas sp. CNPT3]
MSRQQKQLMTAWDKMYPVDAWECLRTEAIAKLQGDENIADQEL